MRFEEGPLMGYEREQLEDAFSRYLPPLPDSDPEHPEQPAWIQESRPFEHPEQGLDVPGQKVSSNPHGHSDVPDVPAELPLEGDDEDTSEADYWADRLRAHESGAES
jgi:hypothetical protein